MTKAAIVRAIVMRSVSFFLFFFLFSLAFSLSFLFSFSFLFFFFSRFFFLFAVILFLFFSFFSSFLLLFFCVWHCYESDDRVFPGRPGRLFPYDRVRQSVGRLATTLLIFSIRKWPHITFFIVNRPGVLGVWGAEWGAPKTLLILQNPWGIWRIWVINLRKGH